MAAKNDASRGSLPALASALLFGPVGLGLLATVAFYGLIRSQVLTGTFFHRYFDSYWCLQVETAMFFVGAAALGLKLLETARQRRYLARNWLDPLPPQRQKIEDCRALLAQLDRPGAAARDSLLAARLRNGLLFVERKQSAEALDAHLRHLAELDALRRQESYGLVRIVLWAIPILGFLGTVIGVTMAIAALNPADMESSIGKMSDSLFVAFDTTAVALSLSIPLMFGMFYVRRQESRLMDEVDARAEGELMGRFERVGTASDPAAASIRRMGEEVIRATQSLVHQQADIWRHTIEAAHADWAKAASGAARQTEDALAAALDKALRSFAGQIAAAERAAGEENRRHWHDVQQALVKAADANAAQQRDLARQADVLLKVVEATGQVTRLENELNRNLGLLAGAKLFEETLSSLAAAVHLLTARLDHAAPPPVQLTTARNTGKAA